MISAETHVYNNITAQTSAVCRFLTGLSPPRKSAASVCMWQLIEKNFWPTMDASIWQMVVLPHLRIEFYIINIL